MQVGQINLQHNKAATAELAKLVSGQLSTVILIQEPYYFRGAVRGLGGAGGTLLVPPTREDSPRTSIWLSSDLSGFLLPQLGSRDCTAAIVGHKVSNNPSKLVMGSIYLPYDDLQPRFEDLKKLEGYSKNRNLPLLIGCDANAHHTVWGSSNTNPRGELLLECVAATGLELLNRGTEATFINAIRREVLDITLASRQLVGKVQGWRVTSDITTSDHRLIRMNLPNVKRGTLQHARNPRRADWAAFKAVLHEQHRGEENSTVPPHLPALLDKEVEQLSKTIIDAYETVCPLKPVSPKRVQWWSEDLEKRKKEVKRLFNKAYRTRQPADWESYKESARFYKSELRCSKREAWRSYCQEIENVQEASRLNKILSSAKRDSPGAMQRPEGTWTTSEDETLSHLLETHFPNREEEQDEPEARQAILAEPDWELAREVVSAEALDKAAGELAPYKAPGPDGIIPKMIIEGLEAIRPELGRLYSSSVALGYVPKTWRAVRIIFIPKGGKDDYTRAKSYRPLSLTSFLLKILEKMVKEYLVTKALKNIPIKGNQHAFQKGKSTDTALHSLVSRLERSLHHKEESLGLFFDVEGAFDKTSPLTVTKALEHRGVRRPIVKWIDQMLRDRNATASIDGTRRRLAVKGGCPQGSSLSPILWCLVMDELLELLASEGFYAQAFADDGAILVGGKFLDVICDRMQTACRILERWSAKLGLAINPAKTELVLFSHRRKREGFKPPQLFGDEIQLSNRVKYLGITLDCRLNWSPHIDLVKKKAVATFWQVRRAVGKTWGLAPHIAHWIYTAIIRPRIQYGAVVWWKAAGTKTNIRKLSRLQRLGCLCVTGAFSTTPTRAMERLLSLTPLHIAIKAEAIACLNRLRNCGQWNEVGELVGHRSIAGVIESEIPVLNYKHPKTPEIETLGPRVVFRYPTQEQWESGLPTQCREGTIQCYTDGSWMKSTGMAGAGLFVTDPEAKLSFPLGKDTTVFQAELYAIIVALRWTEENTVDKDIDIFSDSKSAMQAVEHNRNPSELVKESRQLLAKIGLTRQIRITWVPGHKGVQGNETADELARSGAAIAFCGPEPTLGLSKLTIKGKIKDWATHRASKEWSESGGLRQAKMMLKWPSTSKTEWLLRQSRTSTRLLTGVLTGHCGLRRHLKKCGIVTDETCPKCGHEPETAAHYLARCEAFSALRFRLLEGDPIREADLAKLEWTRILDFVRRSGRFATEQ